MEIKITIDATPLKRLMRRLGKRRLFAGTVAAVVLGASTYAYAIADPIAFTSGDVISSADVNTNFSVVYAAVATVEADVLALQDAERPQSCEWVTAYVVSDSSVSVECPANKHPIGGACQSISGTIADSLPTGLTGLAGSVTAATGWECRANGDGVTNVAALCCSF